MGKTEDKPTKAKLLRAKPKRRRPTRLRANIRRKIKRKKRKRVIASGRRRSTTTKLEMRQIANRRKKRKGKAKTSAKQKHIARKSIVGREPPTEIKRKIAKTGEIRKRGTRHVPKEDPRRDWKKEKKQ